MKYEKMEFIMPFLCILGKICSKIFAYYYNQNLYLYIKKEVILKWPIGKSKVIQESFQCFLGLDPQPLTQAAPFGSRGNQALLLPNKLAPFGER